MVVLLLMSDKSENRSLLLGQMILLLLPMDYLTTYNKLLLLLMDWLVYQNKVNTHKKCKCYMSVEKSWRIQSSIWKDLLWSWN